MPNPNPSRVDDVELTALEAATWFRVTQDTVWQWVHRAKLRPTGRSYGANGRWRNTYRFGDLCRAAYGDKRADLRRTLPTAPENHVQQFADRKLHTQRVR